MITQNSCVSTQGNAEPRMLPAPSPRRGEGVPPCRDESRCSPTSSASTRSKLLICALTLICTASLAYAQGDPARGEKKFEDCAACHSLTAGENGVGPSLAGVIGRKAATLDDYRYSPALKRSNIVWSPQTLDNFIADPQKAVPANRMPYAGLTNAGERADLIAYLQKMSK
jgi:cytochrome c2